MNNRIDRMQFPIALALLICGMVLLMACTPISPPTLTSTLPPPVQKLKINIQAFMGFAPFMIAEDEGYFDKYGIEVEFVEASSADALPLVMSGELDVVVSTLTAGLFNALKFRYSA